MVYSLIIFLFGLTVFGVCGAPHRYKLFTAQPGVCTTDDITCGALCLQDADCAAKQMCCHSNKKCGPEKSAESKGECPRDIDDIAGGRYDCNDPCDVTEEDKQCKPNQKCCFTGDCMQCVDELIIPCDILGCYTFYPGDYLAINCRQCRCHDDGKISCDNSECKDLDVISDIDLGDGNIAAIKESAQTAHDISDDIIKAGVADIGQAIESGELV
ncbi:uncharacterized protein LOC144450341 [Glandiceps talaboti]